MRETEIYSQSGLKNSGDRSKILFSNCEDISVMTMMRLYIGR